MVRIPYPLSAGMGEIALHVLESYIASVTYYYGIGVLHRFTILS